MYLFLKKSTAIALAIILALPLSLYPQVLPYMPAPSALTLPAGNYDLPTLKGIRFEDNNPFKFTFIFNRGSGILTESVLRAQAEKMGKYFLAALTVPGNDLWVNLSPYEKNRVIPQMLGQTDLGKDMLGEDYVLKQLAASLTYPDTPAGRAYWRDLQNLKSQISNLKSEQSFQKVWIVPNKIHIYESPNMVVIDYAKLKVLCDEDYLAQSNSRESCGDKVESQRVKEPGSRGSRGSTTRDFSKQATIRNDTTVKAFKDHILPTIEKEVNEGKYFTHLRQIYSAVILAIWFRDKLKQTILGETYFSKNKIKGADAADINIKQKIYDEYVKAFNAGVYNMVKTERTMTKITKRTYFCGGAVATEESIKAAAQVTPATDESNSDRTSGEPRVDVAGEAVTANVGVQPKAEPVSEGGIFTDWSGDTHVRDSRASSLPENLRLVLTHYGVGVVQDSVDEWNERERLRAKKIGVGFEADGAADMAGGVICARAEFRFVSERTGGPNYYARLVGHELGHILDNKMRLMELLAQADNDTILEIAQLGFGGEKDEYDVNKWRAGLASGDRNDISGEAVAEAFGKIIAQAQEYRATHPNAYKFFNKHLIAPALAAVSSADDVAKGGVDLADASKQDKTVRGGGVIFSQNDALSFLKSPDFAGIALRIESVSLN